MKGERYALEPGETRIVTAHASFRGAAAASARATFALGSARVRRKAWELWVDHTTHAGFPPAPPDMVLVLTDRRLLIGRPDFWGRAPADFGAAVTFDRIAEAVALRHGIVVGLAIALRNGQIVELEAMRGAKLRRIADELNARVTSS